MEQKGKFSNRWGYIWAALGMCIGTGNVWRFPRVCAANGGGAFIVAWTIATLIYAVPLLSSEMVMGKKARLGTVGGFRDFVGKKFTWMGVWVCGVCVLLLSYYSVVMAYCLKYFWASVTSFEKNMSLEFTTNLWNNFTANSVEVLIFHFICMGLACVVVYQGIAGGIEKFCKVLVPGLLILLTAVAIYTCLLPGASAGLEYLFTIDMSYLAKSTTWLNAFTQAAWSTGAGWGFIITLSVYTDAKEEVPNNCMIMGLGDNIGALLAGFVVMPAIFALSPSVEAATEAVGAGNYGMTFIYLYQLFSTMPGGRIISIVFFFAMSAAALTSMFSMVEVGTSNVMDLGVSRKKAVLLVSGVCFVMGAFSAWNVNFCANQDWVWGVGLMVSGLLFAVAIIKYGVKKVLDEEINTEYADFKFPKWYYCTSMYLMPVFVVLLVGWWGIQSIGWYPETWWSPFEKENLGTIIFQFAILLAISFGLNNTLAKKIAKGPMSKEN